MADEEPYYGSAATLIPKKPNLKNLRVAAAGCTACHLWKNATQTVFGEGAAKAKLMLVGEQPGDKEDIEGKPFVGPAGKLLDAVLQEVGIDPADVYTTNAVKHFKWVPKGGRRIHAKPIRYEVEACIPWLEAEIKVVEPEVIVCLGATAAQALLGKDFRVTKQRGQILETPLAEAIVATVHPSSILRAPDDRRNEERELFKQDLPNNLPVRGSKAYKSSYIVDILLLY